MSKHVTEPFHAWLRWVEAERRRQMEAMGVHPDLLEPSLESGVALREYREWQRRRYGR